MRSSGFVFVLLLPTLAGCAFFNGNAVSVSGAAVSMQTKVPQHVHVQVDNQCVVCLRHVSESITARVTVLDGQVVRYGTFAKDHTDRMVKQLTTPPAAAAELPSP